MKEDKKSFIVYCDIKEQLDDMTDEEVGKLFRGMVDYSLTKERPGFDRTLNFIFTPIRQQMDRDSDKWGEIKKARSIAGKKGAEARKNKAKKEKTLYEGQLPVINSKQTQAKVSKGKQTLANQAVNVNVNDNVNVNVNDNVIQLADALLVRMEANAGAPCERFDDEALMNVQALLDEGYTEQDLFEVVDYRWEDWKDATDMHVFYTPSVLFGNGFDESIKQARQYKEHRKKLKDFKEQEQNDEKRAED